MSGTVQCVCLRRAAHSSSLHLPLAQKQYKYYKILLLRRQIIINPIIYDPLTTTGMSSYFLNTSSKQMQKMTATVQQMKARTPTQTKKKQGRLQSPNAWRYTVVPLHRWTRIAILSSLKEHMNPGKLLNITKYTLQVVILRLKLIVQ